jgi:hypothetical protein
MAQIHLDYRCGCRETWDVSRMRDDEPELVYIDDDCDVTVCMVCKPHIEQDGYICPNGRGKHLPTGTPLEEIATKRERKPRRAAA